MTGSREDQVELLARILGPTTIPNSPEVPESRGPDHFELFRLPPELRLLIYEFAVVESKPKVFIKHISNERSWAPFQQPAISRTCREIRGETIKLFYGSNAFEVHDPNVTIDCLYRDIRSGLRIKKIVRSMGPGTLPFRDVFDWLKKIGGHNTARIKALSIRLPHCDSQDEDNRCVPLSRMETVRAEIQEILVQYSKHAGFALPSEITLGRHEQHDGVREETGFKTMTLEFSAGSHLSLSLRTSRLRYVVLRWKGFRWRVLRLGLPSYPRALPEIAALEVVLARGPWVARR